MYKMNIDPSNIEQDQPDTSSETNTYDLGQDKPDTSSETNTYDLEEDKPDTSTYLGQENEYEIPTTVLPLSNEKQQCRYKNEIIELKTESLNNEIEISKIIQFNI